MLNKRFLFYNQYAVVNKANMFTKEQLANVGELQANNLATTYYENTGNGFVQRQLPIEAQYAPVMAIEVLDINKDGKKDILLAGNNMFTRIKFSTYDANRGAIFIGDGKGGFSYMPQWQSGLSIKGCVRDIVSINTKSGKNLLMLGVNNQAPVFLNY
jgi:hypothetical protein